MLTPRDRKVLLHIGLHGWLSHKQIGLLEFPSKTNAKYSYAMLQRRIREELLPEKYIDYHRLPNREGKGFIPIFRLTRKGAKLYKNDTGYKAKIPRFSQLKLPHRLEVNNIIIELKSRNIIKINGFELEKKLGNIRPDSYIKYKIPFCLEVDLSGGETKDFIQNKWISYDREYINGKLKCSYVVWYSKRADTLKNWIEEISNSRLIPIFIDPPESNIIKVIDYLKKELKTPLKCQ